RELIRVTVPRVFQEGRRDVVHGVLDPLVEEDAQLFDRLQADSLTVLPCHRCFQVNDGRAETHPRQITDLLALFVYTERAKFHVFSLENGLIFRIQNYCGWTSTKVLRRTIVHD